MQHLNKSNGTKAAYRGNSSIAMIGHDCTGTGRQQREPGHEPKSLTYLLEPVGDVCPVD